ncbi:hypothetical protein ACET3Z_005248 [Daucus carota]
MDHVIDLEGTSMLCTISNLYNEFDQHFKDFMDETRESRCLLNILKIPATSILTLVVHYLLNFYEDADTVFSMNGQVLCISLEDVVYITGLPIEGSAIINDKNRNLDCFDQMDHVIDLKGTSMLCIISNLNNELDQRFKDFLYETRESRCLLNILKIPATKDVLYITGLPIERRTIINDKNRDMDGFDRGFGIKKTKLSINELSFIAKDTNETDDTRKRAILLIIVRNFIVPDSIGV